MSVYLHPHLDPPHPQLALSRQAADRYAQISAAALARAGRRSRTAVTVRRLRRTVAATWPPRRDSSMSADDGLRRPRSHS